MLKFLWLEMDGQMAVHMWVPHYSSSISVLKDIYRCMHINDYQRIFLCDSCAFKNLFYACWLFAVPPPAGGDGDVDGDDDVDYDDD